jgi:hypothetical protein
MQTGQMPPLGSGKNATLMRSNIYNMVFQLQKGKMTDDQIVSTIANNKQNRAAEQQALKSFSGSIEGRKVTSTNPWGANTLEWTTPINPGHGNWPGDIPEVHRWAYDYSKDGREFIPQTEPIGADESKH